MARKEKGKERATGKCHRKVISPRGSAATLTMINDKRDA